MPCPGTWAPFLRPDGRIPARRAVAVPDADAGAPKPQRFRCPGVSAARAAHSCRHPGSETRAISPIVRWRGNALYGLVVKASKSSSLG